MVLRGRPLFDGVEAAIGCMKCGEMFSMTLGSVFPFTNSGGQQGFMCLPCLEELNHARVGLRLSPFPVPLVGYRGRPVSDEPESLTLRQWRSVTDGRELIRFAAPRIPPQHLGLVLASLAASSWSKFHQLAPEDLRPALAIGTLRAWCHGEATAKDLGLALEEVRVVARSIDPRRDPAAKHAVAAVWSALEAVLMSIQSGPRLAVKKLANEVSRLVESVVCAEVEDANTRGVITRETREQQLGATARLIRSQLPWPATPSSRWEASPGIAISGGAVLRIDNWEIGDAVTMDEFNGLSGPRAVAFDAAQLGCAEHLGSEWQVDSPEVPVFVHPAPVPSPRQPEPSPQVSEAPKKRNRLVRTLDQFFETLKQAFLIGAVLLYLAFLIMNSWMGP